MHATGLNYMDSSHSYIKGYNWTDVSIITFMYVTGPSCEESSHSYIKGYNMADVPTITFYAYR